MLRISQTNGEIKRLIETAEMAWFEVFYSADTNKVIYVNGREYYRLPLRFSTKAKVLAYFRQYWGITMSSLMFRNLITVTKNGRLYVVAGDTGPLPIFPRQVTVTSRTDTRIRVTAALSIVPESDDEILMVRYVISKSGTRLIILNRNQKEMMP
ncbi:DL-endopeptidase inhibitor IseA family protein [Paenibacillus pedocola]|uniref:DL-endopeptidase inhibitor IseA family protein n=1 Tax=Paenibacillus pedocola TaxID=3242193 RepID=UPI0028775168|nr:DL-endopeptidase inhibitor IseA family protein [Paenibacillus typhae]